MDSPGRLLAPLGAGGAHRGIASRNRHPANSCIRASYTFLSCVGYYDCRQLVWRQMSASDPLLTEAYMDCAFCCQRADSTKPTASFPREALWLSDSLSCLSQTPVALAGMFDSKPSTTAAGTSSGHASLVGQTTILKPSLGHFLCLGLFLNFPNEGTKLSRWTLLALDDRMFRI
ncbi:hypothetical protein BCR44DRAFT_1011014 [Catenaria anguillulae PL171]|uniref:Uncharacterized protein n=1 Tax=Catenaria anguillulae PL171 TaxID=765915 RepID=A0A1Y2I432_9FUNG|nr:hypothetical protein BCR44DRAFT_1011014 [Catenaria anguillulae PL171]